MDPFYVPPPQYIDNEKPNQKCKKMTRATIVTLIKSIERYNKISDPVIKYTLVLDKFHMLLDLLATLTSSGTFDEVDDNLAQQMQNGIENIHNDLDGLESWIHVLANQSEKAGVDNCEEEHESY
jgi:hypothetical protein